MKIEFKQSFQEDGKEYKIKYKGKAEQADVPAYFVFLATFFALLKSGLIKILEIEKDEFENMPEEYKGHEERLSEEDELVLRDAIESAEFKGEESEEDEESEDAVDSEESEEIVAEDESEDEESEDEGSEEELEEKKKKTGDSALLSKAEILAPGIKQSKDIKKVALATAYKTADGKKIIDALTGGKDLSKISGVAETAIFNAAAEMMKAKRVNDHASARVTTIDSFPSLKGTGAKSAEDINKQNAEFYNSKK